MVYLNKAAKWSEKLGPPLVFVKKYETIVPNRLVLISSIEDLNLEKFDLSDVDECIIRMAGCRYGEPLCLMLLATKIRRLWERFPETKFGLSTSQSDFRGYADYIGFFRFMGFNRGNSPGVALGSTNYTPITIFDIDQLISDAGAEPIGLHVSKIIVGLAQNLAQENEGPVYDLMEYSLREIIRNAAEHSRGKQIAVLCQCWPAKQTAEIVVMDNGVGIAENLYDNEYLECETNAQALKFAMMPGVTGVSLSERIDQDDHWGNSGFGLYVTSRFCSENGSFRVISGKNGLTLSNGNQAEHAWSYDGTCVQLRLSFDDAKSKVDRKSEIIDEGTLVHKETISDYPINASVASQLLASNFKK